jgi:hypothetical protein
MARTYTIAQLITRTRAEADVTGADVFLTDAELQTFLDVAYAELVDLLARASIHQFETSTTITTDGTNDSFAVPADHYKTLAIDYRYATDRYSKVEPLMFEERNDYSLGINGSARGYRLVGSNIVFYPKPPSGQVYRHIYIPAPANISAVVTSTAVDGVAGWEEYIVVHAAKTIKQKQEDDAAIMVLNSKLRDLEERINTMAQDRDAPRRIVDVNEPSGDFYHSRWGWNW